MSKHSFRVCFALAAAALVAVACGGGAREEAPAPSAEAPAETAPAAPAGGGSVTGVVNYQDGDPDTPIAMDADPVCAGLHTTPTTTETVVGDGAGHLANVFVYVKDGLAPGNYPKPTQAATLDQKGCQYHPHVQGVVVGQPVKIINSDPTLHNIHAHPTKNEEFNQGQPFQGMEMERTFTQVEVPIPFRCDVHPWMASYIAVLDHPFFAVSGADGSFAIQGLPAGTYTLEAWHEKLGSQTQSVTVAEGQPVQVTFDFKPTA